MFKTVITRLGTIALMLSGFVPLVTPASAQTAEQPAPPREIEIVVDGGYRPAKITVRQGERVRLRFIRKEYTGCTREVVFPTIGLRRELPPNQPVIVELPALPAGEYEFRCGMNMVRGAITVSAS
jgi:plastocyanin domain-containing protein